MKEIQAVGRVSGINKDDTGKYTTFVSFEATSRIGSMSPLILKDIHLPLDTAVAITIEFPAGV